MTKIKEIPKEERPVEKMLQNGASYLSNEELLAIILKTGTKEISSKELAENILIKSGGLSKLKNLTLHKLLNIKGIGIKKATTLLAVFELFKRMESYQLKYGDKITSCVDVVSFFEKKFKDEMQEYFYCIYLDTAKKIIDNKLLFKGTLNHSLVHPREVFKYAYLNGAHSIILVHNHPSGEVTPSKEDIYLTKHLSELSKLHDIKIDDHIIIGKKEYFSFFENHILEEL